MQNSAKDKIGRGEVALGVSLMFPAPQLVEMLAYAGFDWVLIDCEHGSIGLAEVEVMAMAADAAGITAIARPRSNAAADIQSVLDRGVAGVQIPHINTRADAERALAAVKFGPGAGRGLAAGTRPDRWGLGGRMPDFAAKANAQSLVCVQIEHQEAVANIDDILKVDGIDVFFIGPSDLSQSMGYPGEPNAPPVAQAIEQTLAAIHAAGKAPGMPATAETLPNVIGRGCATSTTTCRASLAPAPRNSSPTRDAERDEADAVKVAVSARDESRARRRRKARGSPTRRR